MIVYIPVMWLHPIREREFEDGKENYEFEIACRYCVLNAVTYPMVAEAEKHEDEAHYASSNISKHNNLVNSIVEL